MLKSSEVLEQLDQAIEKAGIHVIVDDRRLLGSLKGKIVALDVEHDESGGFVCVGICDGIGNRVFCFFDLPTVSDILRVAPDLILHNGITDIEVMQTWGINVSYKQCVWDTMLIGHILDSSKNSYALKEMAKELGIEYPSYDQIVGKRGLRAERVTLDQQPPELVAKYNAMDVWTPWQLARKQGINDVLRVL